ncbi:hypothetical protein QN277_018064 [Acacia crassicarpa]|uniref:Structure-specific endonuclease subunit SLX1 homolog n=1 Tax=Acacia crassicarpa TaxID=499986 RepID=A0AAE1JVH1_9FABA|nr:hypothetical protein QN277_018064 [Acacia crassicarpa]
MRKRKGRSEASKPLNPQSQEAAIEEQNTVSDETKGFFACYLLASLNPRFKGHTYIGFTVNPRRRIRQHNGEIGCGAWRTKRKRPWEMVLCIYGFPTNVSALQFEWAWQHPVESLAVRKAAATFKSLSGIANKIKLAYTMLTLPSWQSLNMTVNFLSTKYTKHSAGCPSLPEHMKVHIRSMDELPCYTERIEGLSESEDVDPVEGGGTTEEECSVITSNIDSIPDTFNGSLSHLSSQDEESEARAPCDSIPDTFDGSITHISLQDKESEAREPCDSIPDTFDGSLTHLSSQDKESEAREPFDSFASLDKRKPFGSIMSAAKESSPVMLSRREEIIEVTDMTNSMNESCDKMSQADCIQSGTISAANNKSEESSEAEIIDLCTPSACCSFSIGKKRRVPRAGTDFIDLTKSPNFIQL